MVESNDMTNISQELGYETHSKSMSHDTQWAAIIYRNTFDIIFDIMYLSKMLIRWTSRKECILSLQYWQAKTRIVLDRKVVGQDVV